MINAEIDEFDHLIRVLSKELNIGVAIVEHRIELLETIADRVMVMDAGETIAAGSLAAILADRVECGNLSINHFVASVAETPFGGVKDSGYGREGGTEGLACYTVTKNVSHKTA